MIVSIATTLIFIGWIVWLLWSTGSTVAQIGGILVMCIGGALAVVAIIVAVCGFFWRILCQAEAEAKKESLPKCCSFRKRL